MKFLVIFFIIAFANGLHITCNFNFGSFATLGSVYTCDVIDVDFSGDSANLESVTGDHLPSLSNFDVQFVYFSTFNCPKFNLEIVPQNLELFFKNITGLQFESCDINTLKGNELINYKNLKYFCILYTKLAVVPGNLFNTTPNMIFAFFSYNKITEVGSGLLNNLTKLRQAHFGSNVCISKYAAYQGAIPDLIKVLNQNCSHIEPVTATMTSTTKISTTSLSTSTTIQPIECKVDNFNEYACELNKEILSLSKDIESFLRSKN